MSRSKVRLQLKHERERNNMNGNPSVSAAVLTLVARAALSAVRAFAPAFGSIAWFDDLLDARV